jgi:SAM-dependent methyltransferase
MARTVNGVAIGDGIELRYDCDRTALPLELRGRFQALEYDGEARQFVEHALAHRHGALRTAAYGWLRRALSDYDAYGLLGMYAMHLLGTEQLRQLLATGREPHGALLDVGAGRGDVARLAAPLFARVSVTEASRVMRVRLRAQGHHVIAHDLARTALPASERFDAILCLNVLDRCAYPRSLLRHLRAALATRGKLLLAVPLPLAPHVQRAGSTADPEEPLPAAEPSWEAGAASIAGVLGAAGLRIERLARAPYVCRGDASARLHVLDDALFVCTADDSAAHEVSREPPSV